MFISVIVSILTVISLYHLLWYTESFTAAISVFETLPSSA